MVGDLQCHAAAGRRQAHAERGAQPEIAGCARGQQLERVPVRDSSHDVRTEL